MAPVECKMMEAGALFPNGGSATHKKTDMTHVYLEDTPAAYIDFLGPKRYGVFQDRLCKFLAPTRKALLAATPTPRLFDLGALYGNTTLALTNGMDWDETCSFWLGNQRLRSEFRVSAFDLSRQALSYGKRVGMYENVYVGDMNERFEAGAEESLRKADMLACCMALNYSVDGRWEEICKQFLQDRSRDKYILYSTVCAFDDRDFSPFKLFADVKGWSSEQLFCLHREFFEEETAVHDGCGESWAWVYNVKFEKL